MAKSIIVYDDACPMCKLYTAGFEKAGWVNRTGFSTASELLKGKLDLNRARHEIPLYDVEKGEVHYGMDALFTILGERIPLFKPLFAFPPFRWIIYGLYQIITYNRRVIAGSTPPVEGFDCAPDRHIPMRLLYIFLAAIGIAFLLIPMDVPTPFLFVFLGFHFLLLVFGLFRKKDNLDFLGHWITVLLAATLLLSFSSNILISIALGFFTSIFLWVKRAWVLK